MAGAAFASGRRRTRQAAPTETPRRRWLTATRTMRLLLNGKQQMSVTDQRAPGAAAIPTFAELYTPKLLTVLREGYGRTAFKHDLIAGLTVAIVALPLSMAIAIASGVPPDRGLFTAIIGGFIVSALGGSRFQIGGPAGAFIVLVAATVAEHGLDGLLLATMMSGVFLLAIGYARLGTYIKFIPYPVTVGFTAGIAVIIFASQLSALFGLTLPSPEPGALVPKLIALFYKADTMNISALFIALLTVGVIVGLKRLRPTWPGMLLAVLVASTAATALALPVETIGTRFGGIPRTLPAPSLPDLSLDKAIAVLPAAISFTLLGAIESPSVGCCRRRHDGPPASFKLRACRTRFRQYRFCAVRRHLRHGHDRPHGDQCTVGRAWTRCWHDALAFPGSLHASGRSARQLYTAGGIGRGVGRCRLQHA